ncbi:hypothetical protein TRP8649_00395 [Pelagimonas phthalicica]|uniref:Uncharacterized protein n=1 Tax=Pelagimonas phthalicica TaxID=1037362 RepID=A0A238J6D6_9RHOB|nr:MULTISPECIES: hypothetical protein [Roseobacteraceae]MBO9463964.1 hypothetical protein [Tropicibacter sp. R15_0]TDS95155.1 hypothetical protein CLV87_1677 [Pelagimonas phthalicica]SMX26321.1 hypothetical protein TRP8649_00395 [Pelagimonas phthalicica]
MIEIAHTSEMERAIKVAHAERSAAFVGIWRSLFSILPKPSFAPKPQAMPVGHA